MRQSCELWSLKKLFIKLFFIFVVLQKCLGYQTFQEVKRQGLIPLVRLGRNTMLTSPNEKVRRGNMIVSPRLGKKAWSYPHNLILEPQDGYQVIDDDTLSSVDYGTPDHGVTLDDFVENKHRNFNKRLVFIPRVGRK